MYNNLLGRIEAIVSFFSTVHTIIYMETKNTYVQTY